MVYAWAMSGDCLSMVLITAHVFESKPMPARCNRSVDRERTISERLHTSWW